MNIEDYTSDYLKGSMLGRIPDTIDKREGSVIYDTTIPVSEELYTYYTNLSEVKKQAYAKTATGAFLDFIVAEVGLSRYLATNAIKKGLFADDNGNALAVNIGERFSIVSTNTILNYVVIAVYADINGNTVPGSYQLQCEDKGIIGNDYIGELLPINLINGLASATMTDLITPARDDEDDESLRTRYFDKVDQQPFGGNIAQYREYLLGIAGVGAVQIYPTWNGGGTVKTVILDSQYNPISNDFKNQIQTKIDPMVINGTPVQQGLGLGLAPIGHRVTVDTASQVIINISATITLAGSFSIGQVTPTIETALSDYIQELEEAWDVADVFNNYALTVYLARIGAAMLAVNGVVNVANPKINGVAADLVLTQSKTLQQIPKLGVINVGS